MTRRFLTTLVLVAFQPGCTGGWGGTETGNAAANMSMLARRTDGDASATVDQTGAEFGFDGVRAYVREIHLELDTVECADFPAEGFVAPVSCTGSTVTVEGPYVVDLLAATAQPTLDGIVIPAAAYSRVDVRFDEADPSDGLVAETDSLANLSFLATGDADLDGTRPFRMELGFNEDARFESPEGVSVEDGTTLLLLLDPTSWFALAPLATCYADGDLQMDGTTVLVADSGGSCSDIEQALKEAIKTSGQLEGE